MKYRIVAAAVITALLLAIAGCGKALETAAPPTKKEKPPQWPEMSMEDVALDFNLHEAHYHMRRARHTAPGSFGSYNDMAIAMGYVEMAYEENVDNDHAMRTADHLVREHGTKFRAPYGHVARCKWCGYPMPRQFEYWPTEGGQKVVECPNCGAQNSFPSRLVHTCSWCNDVKAGTHLSPYCDECGRTWAGTDRRCPACGGDLNTLARGRSSCPHCGAVWNEDVAFADWPRRAGTYVDFTGEGTGEFCTAYTSVTGFPCPNRTTREAADNGNVKCWVHRHQAERDKQAQEGGAAAAPAAAGAGAPGGMGGMPGGPPGGGGMMGPGGPPGGMMGPGAGAGGGNTLGAGMPPGAPSG